VFSDEEDERFYIYFFSPDGNSHPFPRVDMCVRDPVRVGGCMYVWVCVRVGVCACASDYGSPFVGGKDVPPTVE